MGHSILFCFLHICQASVQQSTARSTVVTGGEEEAVSSDHEPHWTAVLMVSETDC